MIFKKTDRNALRFRKTFLSVFSFEVTFEKEWWFRNFTPYPDSPSPVLQTLEERADFLHQHYLPMLRALPADAPRLWGKLSQQGIIEHMADSVRIANGNDLFDCDKTEAHIERSHEFIRSEGLFPENTVNVRMPAEPPTLRWETKEEALEELKEELNAFFDLFADDHERLVTHPSFGDLDYELWVRLLYKHASHHLRQYGVEMHPPAE